MLQRLFMVVLVLSSQMAQAQWPAITKETRPWTRWWWHGSSVTRSGLTTVMEQYQKAGLGGLELTPIYGVKGDEANYIPYLSDKWLKLLQHAGREARRFGLGLDMAMATGWPFGGPWVDEKTAARYQSLVVYPRQGGKQDTLLLFHNQLPVLRAVQQGIELTDLHERISEQSDLQALALGQVRFEKRMNIEAVVAFSENQQAMILTDLVDQDGQLQWTAPPGNWNVCALYSGLHGKLVERAAPGGEGYVIDHFSRHALGQHLQVFDQALAKLDSIPVRAFFNDSYEVDDAEGQADFTPRFFEEFQTRRGYDLRWHLSALYEAGVSREKFVRVLSDYSETLSDLLLEEFTQPWKEWAHTKKALTRNQAHGSPANILDLYAASDIPETEGREWLKIGFASSAAHVAGKKFVSAEAATWLGEHFTSTLAEVKSALDLYFLNGVNHVFYHGTPYSPPEEPWPGRLFYASVHFAPSNSFWDDFASLNRYVSRCQSFLQDSAPDNDLLLYFPYYDLLAQPGRSPLVHFSGGFEDYQDTPFLECADYMHKNGYSFDLISDRQIKQLQIKDRLICSGQQPYKVILVPGVRLLPTATMAALRELARQGAQVLFYKSMPEDVPGWGNLFQKRQELHHLLTLYFQPEKNIKIAKIGDGTFSVGHSLQDLLAWQKMPRESMVENGVQYIRKRTHLGHVYFCVNNSGHALQSWLPLCAVFSSAVLFDPMTGQYGSIPVRLGPDGHKEVYIEVASHESFIIKTDNAKRKETAWPIYSTVDLPVELRGEWTVSQEKGRPEWPSPYHTTLLGSWTDWPVPGLRDFSGTVRYSLAFKRPAENEKWLLDLGDVRESARIILNGEEIGTLLCAPYRRIVSLRQENMLEVLVSNLMANRIASLDRQKVLWKKFYNVNFPALLQENRGADRVFHADHWPARASGLLGPVTITPVQLKTIVER
jgi:hypothetical protein